MTAGTIHAGVMGWPIEHSLSPRLHGFWLKKYRIDGAYAALPVPPDKLSAALRDLPAQGVVGVNLTVPHKEAALGLVDRLDLAAKRIGAVNTVVVGPGGALEGRNTDAYGFTQNLRAAGVAVKGKRVTVLGAGGAARAVVVALQEMGAGEIRIVNRTRERAAALQRDFSKSIKIFPWARAETALEETALLVNATTLGMRGQPTLDLSLEALPQAAVVADLVYAPLETDLLARGRTRGHKTVDGLGMLLHQARPAFKAFFGVEPEVTDELRAFVLAGG